MVWLSLPLGAKTVDVCFKKPETLTCGTLLKPNGVHEVEWKVYNAEEKQWSCFSYCGKRQGCLIKEKLLSNGITVENVSMVAVTVKASAKDNTNKHSRLLCEVHYKDFVAYKEVKINFIGCKFSFTASREKSYIVYFFNVTNDFP